MEKTTKGLVGFYARNISFSFDDDIPQIWVKNNPFLTCFFDAASITLPESESFINTEVNLSKSKIKDEVLLLQAKELTAQEAYHSKVHRQFNRFIAGKGYENIVNEYEQKTQKSLSWIQKHFSFKWRLAYAAAMEVSISFISQLILNNKYLQNADERVKTIFVWHGMEESEHKAVVFDIYIYLFRNRFVFFTALLAQNFIFLTYHLILACKLLKVNGRLFSWNNIKSFSKFYFGKEGIVWQFIVLLAKAAMPNFTPANFNKINNYQQLKKHYDKVMKN
jgi:predicted metal-dependent hydrolase